MFCPSSPLCEASRELAEASPVIQVLMALEPVDGLWVRILGSPAGGQFGRFRTIQLINYRYVVLCHLEFGVDHDAVRGRAKRIAEPPGSGPGTSGHRPPA